ncbi:MAG: flippase-like domain-containing protein, partial [Chitinophagaceae bacterium]|nr:flippase-like domain-containing protein [Chitinophagaceae bacterium]
MPKKAISILTYLLTLGLGVFLISWSLRGLEKTDIAHIKTALSKARFELLIPILIMGFISHWSRALRWRYLMEPLGIQPQKSNTFFAVMIGYLANMAFPRLGEVMKCTLL